MLALSRALASVHRAGLIHRNLNPRCAHVLRDGRVVLTDFDDARLPDAGFGFTELFRGELGGEYIAPEVRADPAAVRKSPDVRWRQVTDAPDAAPALRPPNYMVGLISRAATRSGHSIAEDARQCGGIRHGQRRHGRGRRYWPGRWRHRVACSCHHPTWL